MGYMFHGFSYPDENPDHNLISRFWTPVMEDGVIRFESPDSPLLDRHIVRHGLNVKESIHVSGSRLEIPYPDFMRHVSCRRDHSNPHPDAGFRVRCRRR